MHLTPLNIRFYGMVILAGLLGSSNPADARIYKWVDADGTVQYTQTPPPGDIAAEEIKPPPRVDSNAATRALDEQRAVLDKSRDTRIKSAEKEQQSQQELANKQQQCEQARLRLASYERPRVNVVGEDGERRRATEEERTAEIDKAREAVSKLCN